MTDAVTSIPLTKLIAWSGNVRKTGASERLEELTASIAAHGLLQSLIVRKTSRGKFAVIAGQRRLRALTALAKGGSIENDMPIPCRVVSGQADATEISLTENVVRAPMHPADQFDAFRELIDRGATPADIAARFGITEAVVRKRLKLARVSPIVFDAYREGKLTLEQVAAAHRQQRQRGQAQHRLHRRRPAHQRARERELRRHHAADEFREEGPHLHLR